MFRTQPALRLGGTQQDARLEKENLDGRQRQRRELSQREIGAVCDKGFWEVTSAHYVERSAWQERFYRWQLPERNFRALRDGKAWQGEPGYNRARKVSLPLAQ